MLEQYKSLMDLLGYDVEKKGFYLFVCLAEEIRELLKEEKTHDEIIDMLPALMLEEYHFAFDMRKSSYMDYLNEFNDSRKVTPENQQLNICFKLEENLRNSSIPVFRYFSLIFPTVITVIFILCTPY